MVTTIVVQCGESYISAGIYGVNWVIRPFKIVNELVPSPAAFRTVATPVKPVNPAIAAAAAEAAEATEATCRANPLTVFVILSKSIARLLGNAGRARISVGEDTRNGEALMLDELIFSF